MADLNRVCIVGRCTVDATLKTLPSGTQLCEFSIANNRGWGDHAKVHYFNIKMWGKGAASVKKYLVKGKRVAVDGELQLEQWDQDGTKRQKVVISTFDVQLLDGGDKPAQNDDGFAWSKHDDESGGIPF